MIGFLIYCFFTKSFFESFSWSDSIYLFKMLPVFGLPSLYTAQRFHAKYFLHLFGLSRSSRRRCSVKKGILRNFAKFAGKHMCQTLFFNTVAGRLQLCYKQTLAQVFSCKFCEISKNTFFIEHLWAAASDYLQQQFVRSEVRLKEMTYIYI